MKGSNESWFIVQDYFTKKMLAELGYTFDPSTLEQWEVEAYGIIVNTLNDERAKDLKRKK